MGVAAGTEKVAEPPDRKDRAVVVFTCALADAAQKGTASSRRSNFVPPG
jgi:hypothetical protein